MLKGYAKNRLLVGIGKAQHFLLDLGCKLAAQQAIARAGEVPAVVVELGQDFAQLCLPITIRPRPYCQGEDLAVVSPVKHCRHSGFLVSRADATTASGSEGIPIKRKTSQTIQNDPSACIIDGQDIICQEKCRKFLQKGVLCRLRGPGNRNREARSEVS